MQDSNSSSDSESPAGSPALHKINSSQEVSPIRKRYIRSQRYVEAKCRRLMEVVVQLLPLIFFYIPLTMDTSLSDWRDLLRGKHFVYLV